MLKKIRPSIDLKQQYKIAVGSIALLLIVSQIIIQYSLFQQKNYGRVINIAGRQRMLSQKISKSALAILSATQKDEFENHFIEFKKAQNLWQTSHLGLQFGNREMGLKGKNTPDIKLQFKELNSQFKPMNEASLRLIKILNKQEYPELNYKKMLREINVIMDKEKVFLPLMDKIVFTYDAEAQQKLHHLVLVELILTIFALMILTLEVIFIFSPAVKTINRQFVKMSEDAKVITKEKERAEIAEKKQIIANHELEINIKQLKLNEQLLKNSEEKYRLMIENSGNAIVIRQKGKFVFVNNALAQMLDYSKKELLEIDNQLIFTLKTLEKFENFFQQNKDDTTNVFETVLLKKDGTKIEAEIKEKIVFYNNEKAQFAVIRDITKQKLIMKVLKKGAEQTKGLNNFIPICAGCNLIRDDEKKDKPWVKPADYISERLPEVQFSHSMCPDCLKIWYPEFYGKKKS